MPEFDSQKKALSYAHPQNIGTTPQTPQFAAATSNVIQRSQLDPARLRPADVLVLQRTMGNQAVQRMLSPQGQRSEPKPPHRPAPIIQRKRTVGGADDRYEQEADWVARQSDMNLSVAPGPVIQRKMSFTSTDLAGGRSISAKALGLLGRKSTFTRLKAELHNYEAAQGVVAEIAALKNLKILASQWLNQHPKEIASATPKAISVSRLLAAVNHELPKVTAQGAGPKSPQGGGGNSPLSMARNAWPIAGSGTPQGGTPLRQARRGAPQVGTSTPQNTQQSTPPSTQQSTQPSAPPVVMQGVSKQNMPSPPQDVTQEAIPLLEGVSKESTPGTLQGVAPENVPLQGVSKETVHGSLQEQEAVPEVNSDGVPTLKIYLCGHGGHDFNNGFFKLPENTSVTFYTTYGKSMYDYEALAILRGSNPPPSRVITGGQSCPNMTLSPENSKKAQENNEETAAICRAKGHDMVQVNGNETLQEIIQQRGPGYNYIWTCCYSYSNLGRISTSKAETGMNTAESLEGLDPDKIFARTQYGEWALKPPTSDDYLGIKFGQFQKSGDAGGWNQKYGIAPYLIMDIEGKIDHAEIQSSGKMVALEVNLPISTEKLKNPKNRGKRDQEFQGINMHRKAYTVLIRNVILTAVTNPDAPQEQAEGNRLQLLLPTLIGKTIKMKRRTTKFLDLDARILVLDKPDQFSISG
jgi:hypothetical protein